MVAKKYSGLLKEGVLTSALFATGYSVSPVLALPLTAVGVMASLVVEGGKYLNKVSDLYERLYSRYPNYYKLNNAEKRYVLKIAKEKRVDVEELSRYLLDKEKKGEYEYKRRGLERRIVEALRDF